MARKRREKAKRTLKPVHGHIGMILRSSGGLRASEQPVGIDAVDHLHLVSPSSQFVGEVMNKDPIATEIVWRVKRRDHAEAQMVDLLTTAAGVIIVS